MLNRRLIRIKTFQALFGEFGQENSRPSAVVNSVQKSMRGMGNSFFAVLNFLPSFSHYISTEHNPSDFKYNTTSSDLKKFKLITENIFITDLCESEIFGRYSTKPTIDWFSEKDTIFLIFKEVKETAFYKEAIDSELTKADFITFTKEFYKYLLLDSVEFEQLIENKNIYWYDEKIPILKGIERFMDDYEAQEKFIFPALFKNEKEDLLMAEELVENYFEHQTAVADTIGKYTPGWDSDRITKVDYMLLSLALIEFRYMPMIPVKVTLNEYIEIAKMYSTPKSSKFINGTLDKILKDWKDEDLIHKKGRGLIG